MDDAFDDLEVVEMPINDEKRPKLSETRKIEEVSIQTALDFIIKARAAMEEAGFKITDLTIDKAWSNTDNFVGQITGVKEV